MDAKIQEFFMGGVLALFAIVALFSAARSEGAGQYGGVAVFAILIGLIFYRISTAKHGGH
jgi:crotonobetainyl-CoA:carnitine CoA-transferase CaiB-like acyl-CoA transferase